MKTREEVKKDIYDLLDMRNLASSEDEINMIDLQLDVLRDVLFGGKK